MGIYGTVYMLFIDFKKASDSVRREILYNILPTFGILTKPVRLIKTCLNKTYIKSIYIKICQIHFLFRMV